MSVSSAEHLAIPRFSSMARQGHTYTSASKPLSFSGLPNESVTGFLYKAQLGEQNPFGYRYHDHRLIVYISTFLEGEALDWFLALLRQNAEMAYAHENAERAAELAKQEAVARAEIKKHGYRVTRSKQEEPSLSFEPNMPGDWADAPFVIPELQSSLSFFNALAAAFPDSRKVDGTSRSATSTGSDVTLTWDRVFPLDSPGR